MNKSVIVTGATGGIGKSIVDKLILKKFNVIATDVDIEKLNDLKEKYSKDSISTYCVNLKNKKNVDTFFNLVIEKHNNLYSLVNNAGVYYGKPLSEFSENDFNNSLNVNLLAPMILSESFGQYMKKNNKKGCIVNVASVAGEVGSQEAPYGAFKAAIFGLTKSNAMNFSPFLRVNCVSPAAVRETDIWNSIPDYRKKAYVGQELLNDPILPESIANTILFLVSDSSSNITGKTLSVDNGCYPR